MGRILAIVRLRMLLGWRKVQGSGGLWNMVGATSVTTAATKRTRAIGTSRNAANMKMAMGVNSDTINCGRYCPK